MAYTAIGTDQTGWTRIDPLSDDTALATSFIAATGPTPPAAWSSSANRKLVSFIVTDEPVGGNLLQLAFFGTGTADDKASVRFHLVTKYPASGTISGFLATRVAEFDVELGAGVGHDATSPIMSSELAVDTIAITNDLSPTPPGIRIFGDVAGGLAVMEFDLIGAVYMIIEIKENTSSQFGFLWRILA